MQQIICDAKGCKTAPEMMDPKNPYLTPVNYRLVTITIAGTHKRYHFCLECADKRGLVVGETREPTAESVFEDFIEYLTEEIGSRIEDTR